MSPGEAHVVGRPHLRTLRHPRELIGLRIPLSLGRDRGMAQDCGLSIVERDGVFGEPRTKSLASTCRDSLRKATLQLHQQKSAGTKSRLCEWARNDTRGLCESVVAGRGHACGGSGRSDRLSNQNTGGKRTEKQVKRNLACHVVYAISGRNWAAGRVGSVED